MSTNVEALTTRNHWLAVSWALGSRHGSSLLFGLLDALSRGRLQVLSGSDLMRLYPSSQTSNRGWAGTMPPGFKEI